MPPYPNHMPVSAPAQPLRSWHSLPRSGTARAHGGHAQTVRARYLVGGCKQAQQAVTQKRAPVQRRGPHAARRRRSREQVNRTPEGEAGDVTGRLRNRGKWGAIQTSPFYSVSPLGPRHPARLRSAHQEWGWTACTRQTWAARGEKAGQPSADPSSVPDQPCDCKQLEILLWP